ncbi:MAG: hypothetical protein ISR84_04185 [Kiritimatiellales bacterium]|nr:hypothetical protein [Kiritimatiellales bacterium]
MKPLTPEYTQVVLHKIEALPPDAPPEQIEQTAAALQAMNYQPTLLNDAPDFFHMTRSGLVQLIVDLTGTPGNELTEQHLSLLFYHYALLQRLRRNEPEAWDEVNELMEDD